MITTTLDLDVEELDSGMFQYIALLRTADSQIVVVTRSIAFPYKAGGRGAAREAFALKLGMILLSELDPLLPPASKPPSHSDSTDTTDAPSPSA